MKGVSTTSDPHINFYLEDTLEWLALGPKGRLLWPHLARVCQANGCFYFEGLTSEEALSKRLCFPQAFIKEALADLTAGDDPWVLLAPKYLVIPDYHNVLPHEADECPFVLAASTRMNSIVSTTQKSRAKTPAERAKKYRDGKKRDELSKNVTRHESNVTKRDDFRDERDGLTSGANSILHESADLREIVKSILQELAPQLLPTNVTSNQASIQVADNVLPLTSSTISDACSKGQTLVAHSRSQAVEKPDGVSTLLSNSKSSFSLNHPAYSGTQLSVPLPPEVLDRSTDLVKGKKQLYREMGPRIRDDNYLLILSTYNKFLKKILPKSRGCGDNSVNRALIERPFGYLDLPEEEVTDLWLRVIEAQAINVLRDGKAQYFNLRTLNCPNNFERLQSMADVLIEEPLPDYRDMRKYEDEIERSYREANKIAPDRASELAKAFLADPKPAEMPRAPDTMTQGEKAEGSARQNAVAINISARADLGIAYQDTAPAIQPGLVPAALAKQALESLVGPFEEPVASETLPARYPIAYTPPGPCEPTLAELTAELKAISQMLEYSVPMHETKLRTHLIHMSSQIESQIKYKMRPTPPETVEPELRPGEVDWREKFKQGSERVAQFLAERKMFS